MTTKDTLIRREVETQSLRFNGPFVIRIINPLAFELTLPQSYKIHPVFHVPSPQPAVPDRFPGREDPPPPPVTVGKEAETEVKAILYCRKQRRQMQYLVKWKEYLHEENSWEPEGNIYAPRLP